MKKQRIGITGATGFIGRHLIDRLLKEGYQISVFCLNKEPKLPPEVKIIYGDLSSGRGLNEFLKDCDVVIHLAARILPPEEEMYKDNVLATKNLLQKAKKFPIKQVIFMSSAVVYGESKRKIFNEKDKCHPGTEYGKTKLSAEKLVQDWQKETSKIATIFRPFNVYGPGNDKGVIYNLYQSIKENGEAVIFGTGRQKRNFLYVDDLIEAISLVLKKRQAGIFNLASYDNYSILGILKLFRKILRQKIKVKFEEKEKGKVKEINFNSNLVSRALGWRPKTSLEVGLRKTIKSYKKNHD